MQPRTAAPVMTDVARLAGVSHQTVSRVLNDAPNVSEPTRLKVLAAMAELGYRRNAVARALVTRRSGTLGVVAFDTARYGPVSTLYAVEQAAREYGLGVSVTVADVADPETAGRALDRLQEQSVEGVVALAPQQRAVSALAERRPALPIVFVGGELGGGRSDRESVLPAVGIDQYGGAVAATGHLLGLGHRTVHHLAGPSGWREAEHRREGWEATLAGAGVARPAPVAGDWTPRSGHAGMRELLAADPGLSAVFVANDQMALGALRALAEAGRRVPDDVSVVGFDDIPEAEFLLPPLTTVTQDFAEAGRRAVRLLLDEIRPGDAPDPRLDPLVATRLIVRVSSAAPRGR